MSQNLSLTIDGEVEEPANLSRDDLSSLAPLDQIPDISKVAPERKGLAIKLRSLLNWVRVKHTAKWLTLHSSRDNFHASVPLDVVRDRAFIIYELDGQPLPISAGGPFRFLIPDFAACHTAEVDECANVKFVDRIELTAERGFDNRPKDESEHAKLHEH
jgi:DMSO/TMAO reductase YedYZ molybdopterin-dependent catalytic subunit